MSNRRQALAIVERLRRKVDAPSQDGVGYLRPMLVKSFEPLEGGGVAIEGLASHISQDRAEDVIQPAAFATYLRAYLMANPVVLWQHDDDEPIGSCVDAKITPEGLWVRDEIYADTEIGEKACKLIKRKVLRSLSVGGIVHKAQWHQEGENPWAWREITEMELVEHSVVTIACNRSTLFSLAKGLGARTGLGDLARGELRKAIVEVLEGARGELDPLRRLAKAGRILSTANRDRIGVAIAEAREAVVQIDEAKEQLLAVADDLQELLDETAPSEGGEEELGGAELVETTKALARLEQLVEAA